MPNNETAKQVPAIPGLLEYRKDQKKLYVRANKTWNLLAQEKEVVKDFMYTFWSSVVMKIRFKSRSNVAEPIQLHEFDTGATVKWCQVRSQT